MKTCFSIWLLGLMCFTIACGWSSEPERVRAFIKDAEQSKEILVGQKVAVIVEVLSETHFSGSTRLDLPDIAGAVLYKPEERAVVRTKDVNGQTFSVQRHEMAFYAQRVGTFELPPFSVRFGVAGVRGEEATNHREKTKALQIKAVMPPGAENLRSLITATDLKVTEEWSPSLNKEFMVGNAIKRKITFTAEDIPGMVFPELGIAQPNGFKLYRNRAVIQDKMNRGSMVGERVDSLTYVCQNAGTYQFPAIKIKWWNISSSQLKTIILPAVELKVLPNPHQTGLVESSDQGLGPSALSWKSLVAAVALLLVVGWLLFKFRHPISQQFTNWRIKQKESEVAHFKRIVKAQSPVETLNAIYRWIEKVPGHGADQTMEDLPEDYRTPELLKQLTLLQVAVVSPDSSWQSDKLIIELTHVRKQLRGEISRSEKRSNRQALLDLNPK